MLSEALTKGFDKRRLRMLLTLFFLALAVPTAVLTWQAYGQLKWEAFHQHRGNAEALTARINGRLNGMINAADAYSFADFTFLVVSGDPSAKFVQQSRLSAFPVTEDLPGVLGYFQVDAEGVFSTPLLPPAGTPPASLGISDSEYNQRLQLAQEIQAVLSDNSLLRSRQDDGTRRRLASSFAAPTVAVEEEKDANETDVLDEIVTMSDEHAARTNRGYSQQVFDRLNQPRQGDEAAPGKVGDLKLDADLQKKSEAVERVAAKEQFGAGIFSEAPSRSKRTEQIALPETVPVAESEPIANIAALTDLRINTFESEVDPFEFSLLGSGHFVLFRKVWRDGERFIQGLLVDQETFTQNVVGARFQGTAVSEMSNLIIAYQDDVIRTFGGRSSSLSRYPDVAADLDGALLYRSRLAAPFESLEFIFSITHLPPGPGASVLGWVTLVLAVVFVGGFFALYRTGLSQINLARQQQDFVSAVSHELKSPLTSIRMYGEMLKEGWADDEKRQSYYEFIHDESERLSRLISNVLQLANITRNEPQFDLRPIDVATLMANVESKISSQIERAGFELKFCRDSDADRVTVSLDEDCFAQILINLVDNAIKFSKNAEVKCIEIRSKLSGDDGIAFSIRDYGPGIPKDQMKKIFQLFYRSESELTRETVGTGIGLAIVNQLSVAMDGSVDMINAEPGAEFRIRFPRVA